MQQRSWKVRVTREINHVGYERPYSIIAPGDYSLSELTDISYVLCAARQPIASLLVSEVAAYVSSGAFEIQGRWP